MCMLQRFRIAIFLNEEDRLTLVIPTFHFHILAAVSVLPCSALSHFAWITVPLTFASHQVAALYASFP